MTAEFILRQIPAGYSDLQIEASLIKTFLLQKSLDFAAEDRELNRILANSSDDLCALLDRLSNGCLTLKLMEHVFEALVDEGEKRENGVVFTPSYIVDFIIRNTMDGCLKEDSCIMDPACGSGSFLVLAAEYLSRQFNRPVAEVISRHIFGIDISEDNVRRTKELLTLFVLSRGEKTDSLRLHIKAADSLRTDWNTLFEGANFNFIIGNPPYVNTHDMPKDTVSYLKNSFQTTQKGIFNLFYAFIERSMNYLPEGGKLGFILPNNYLTITAAEDLRQYLAGNGYLSKIIDFGENMAFAPVRTYNSLLFLSNSHNQTFEYAVMEKTDDIKTSLETLALMPMAISDLEPNGWKLLHEVERENIQKIEQAGRSIKPYIRVGIATLKDRVYLLDGFDAERGMCFKTVGKERFWIEPEITREIYKVSEIKAESSLSEAKRRIIFPYTEIRQTSLLGTEKFMYQVVPEEVLSAEYPLCYRYLCECRPVLDKRDKGRENADGWYAYGRTQGFGKSVRKLLYPTFSLHPKFMLENNPDTLFCNGYAIMESDEYKLEILQKILNSAVMDYYISKTSYSIESNYKCYQKKYIQRFSLPPFTEQEIAFLSEEHDPLAIDTFLIGKYQLQLPGETQ